VAKIFIIFQNTVLNTHPASAILKAWCATFKTVLVNDLKYRRAIVDTANYLKIILV
jgi:hypothetical protein